MNCKSAQVAVWSSVRLLFRPGTEVSLSLLIEGLLLGLSLGVTCIATCAPVYAPILMQTERGALGALWAVVLMSLGRFLSYAVVGVAAGAIGAVAAGTLPIATIAAVSYIFIAFFLIYTALIRGRAEKHGGCPTGLLAKFAGNPFLAGLVTGFSVCPPFIGAITRGFDSGGAVGGMLLFTGFFVGTTLYFIPMAVLPLFARQRLIRIAGILFSLIAALWFILLGFDHFFDLRLKAEMYFEQAYLVDYAQAELVLVDASGDPAVTERTVQFFPNAQRIAAAPDRYTDALTALAPATNVLLLVTTVPAEPVRALAVENKLNIVWTFAPRTDTDALALKDFLSSYIIKARKSRGFLFQLPLGAP